jgi:hypothetical protein
MFRVCLCEEKSWSFAILRKRLFPIISILPVRKKNSIKNFRTTTTIQEKSPVLVCTQTRLHKKSVAISKSTLKVGFRDYYVYRSNIFVSLFLSNSILYIIYASNVFVVVVLLTVFYFSFFTEFLDSPTYYIYLKITV